MEEYGDSKDKHYPRGRGYGNDYMRGGEIFGGYGYQERADYDRPRGDERKEEDSESDEAAPDQPAPPPHPHQPQDESAASPHSSGASAPAEATGPTIEHTFGDTGGPLSRSRSYYVTQAQLQQRIYAKEDGS